MSEERKRSKESLMKALELAQTNAIHWRNAVETLENELTNSVDLPVAIEYFTKLLAEHFPTGKKGRPLMFKSRSSRSLFLISETYPDWQVAEEASLCGTVFTTHLDSDPQLRHHYKILPRQFMDILDLQKDYVLWEDTQKNRKRCKAFVAVIKQIEGVR